MPFYTETKFGSWISDEDVANIPTNAGNYRYNQMLKEVADGVSTKIPYVEPDPTKEERIAEAKGVMLEARHAPIEWDSSEFDVNGEGVGYENLQGAYEDFDNAVLIAQTSGFGDGTTIPWTLTDNTIRNMSKEDVGEVIRAIRTRAAQLHYDYQATKTAILAE